MKVCENAMYSMISCSMEAGVLWVIQCIGKINKIVGLRVMHDVSVQAG